MEFTCKHKNELKRNVCLCSFWRGFGDGLYIWLCLLPFPLFHLHVPTTVILSPLLEKPRKLTLHWWQQLPWAHSAPSFREQLLALQQGLSHSWKTARCSTVYKADVQDKNGVKALKCEGEKMNYIQCQPFFRNILVKPSICWFTLLHNHILCWTDWVW